jgi:hypothetical protein
MEEFHNTSTDGLSYTMVRKGSVALVELGVGDGTAGDDGFVVTKHKGLTNGDAHVTQGRAEIHDLFSSGTGSTEPIRRWMSRRWIACGHTNQ